jgi:cell division septal protein FtsQ
MKYRQKHIKKHLKSRPKTPFYKRAIFWWMLLFGAILCGAVYLFLFLPNLQISQISVSGANRVNNQAIEDLGWQYATKNFIKVGDWVIASKSIFLVNTDEIKNKVLNFDAVIENVVVEKKWPDKIDIKIKERDQVAVFCQQEHCFYIDANGIIFDELSTQPESGLIVRQNQDDGLADLSLGASVMSGKLMTSIYQIEKKLKDNFQINLTEALITTPTRLNIVTGEGWQIFFDINQDADISNQITKLDLLLKQEIDSQTRQTLEYIDLRFEGRAYYK